MTEQLSPKDHQQQLLQFLERELPLLTSDLNAQERIQLFALLKEIKKPCFKLVAETQDAREAANQPKQSPAFYQIKTLSMPLPRDKENENMSYLGSLNLAALGPLRDAAPKFPIANTVLHIFRAKNLESLNPKEKHAFALISEHFSPAENLSELRALPSWSLIEQEQFLLAHGFNQNQYPENFQQAFKSFMSQFNKISTGEAYLLSQHCNKFPQYFQLASFSMSGISYSEQRAQDWHFKHLIDHAQGYICLAHIDEKFLLQSNFLLPDIKRPQKLLLAIHEDHLKQGELNKAFLMAVRE
jgi:hypothetical protein